VKIQRVFFGMLAALALSAAPALAGPVWYFGPNDEGALKLEYKGQFELRHRDTGASPAGDESATEFNFRRNRLALMGAYGEYLGLYVQTEYVEDVNINPLSVSDGNQSNFQILDAVMRFSAMPEVNVWVGKFKYSLTRENLEACERPLTLDRSLLIRAPFVTTRDKGVAVWGDLAEGMFQYRFDVMNGRNDSLSAPKSNLRYTARAHVSLLDPETGFGYDATYLGRKKVLTIGAAYQMENDIAFRDVAAQTGSIDYKAWTVDGFFEYPLEGIGTVTLSGAYVDYDLDDAYRSANPDLGAIGLNGEKNGYYVKAGYMLPNFPLQFFGRYENWSFAQLNNIINQEVDWYGLGFNWYVRGQNLKVTAEYSWADFDREGTFGGVVTEDLKTFVAQLQLIF
jgi:hypothetical protein